MKRRIQAADSIRFCVRGRGAQRLLGQAAQAGLKLERIAPQADGFTAVVSGAGWAKLCQLAGAGGWQVIQMQRRGPGPLAERLLRRPGILAGIGLFFVLLHWLGGFLWCMDLELLTVPQQESIRTLLAQSGIWEGCRPIQAELAQPQDLILCGQRSFQFSAVFHGKPFKDNQVSNVYLLWLDRDAEKFTLQKEEISAVRWMPLADCLRNVENGALNSCIFPEELRMVQATVEKASAT